MNTQRNLMNYKINRTSVRLDKFTSLLVSLFFENRSNTLNTGRSFQCFVEFFVCDYRDAKRFKWRICIAIGCCNLRQSQNNYFDFDEPVAVHIRHLKRFPVAG